MGAPSLELTTGAAGQVAAPVAVRGACGHCGLPVAPGERYCCFGCELAFDIAREADQSQARLQGVLTLCLVLSMFVMMLSLFLYAEDVYGATDHAQMARLRVVYRWASALLSTPVVLLCGAPLIRRAIDGIRRGRPTMDLLIGSGALAAYGLSLDAVLRGGSHVYFDSATSALMLSTLGRMLEASARAKASKLLGPLLSGATQQVECLDPASGEYVLRAPSQIVPGTQLRVPIDQVVPVDATLLSFQAELNVSVLTGESSPRTVRAGEPIPAGAVPISTAVECVALRSARESTLEQLGALARQLKLSTAQVQRWSDRFAAALVPVVWAVAFGALAYWAARESPERGVIASLAVVLAACPCTYGVVAPLTLWLALRRALEEGVLIRSAGALEALSKVKRVAFDKTGTLTTGALRVTQVALQGAAREADVRRWVASLERDNPHPVGRALRTWAGAAREALTTSAQPGLGVTGRLPDGRVLRLGSRRLLQSANVPLPASLGAEGRVYLALEQDVLARFELEEATRAEAKEALEALRADGLTLGVLTGDTARGARRLGEELGVEIEAELSPQQKVEKLRAVAHEVAMVGDGVNDAPALASVPSFAVERGSDLARGMSQVVLLKPDLRLVPWTLRLARRAMSIIQTSLAVSTAYNLVFVTLAATGHLRPVWAGLSMLTSSLLTLAFAQQVSLREERP